MAAMLVVTTVEDPGILHASVPTSVVIVVTGVLEDAVVKADATIAEAMITWLVTVHPVVGALAKDKGVATTATK